MGFLLTILLIACTVPTFVVSQIDSWKEVLNLKKATAPFRDSLTQIYIAGNPAVYHDSCIVFAINRIIYNPGNGTYSYDAEVFESRDLGGKYSLIGHFTTWPWNDGASKVNIAGVHYLPSGDIFISASDHFLRYQHSTKSWKEVWSAAPGKIRDREIRVPPFATKDIIFSKPGIKAVGAIASEQSDTLISFEIGQNLGATPSNTLFGYARRRVLHELTDDVRYNSRLSEGTPTRCLWSPTLGVAFTGTLLGDDDCRQWERVYPYDTTRTTSGLFDITENGTFVQYPRSDGRNVILASSDLGQRWDSVFVPSEATNESIWSVSNIGGRKLFLVQGSNTSSISLMMAVCGTMSQNLRWPRDSAIERLSVQTLICPEKLVGEIEVEIDDQEDFTSPLDHAITSERYHLVNGLLPRTTYWWRYRYRSTQDSNWSAWNEPWSFSTGACTRWKYNASTVVDGVGTLQPTYYTRMQDGTLVRIGYPGQTVFTSKDQGSTWDSIATFKEVGDNDYKESTSGKLIGRSGSRWYSLDLHTRTFTWILQGYVKMDVFGDRLIAFSQDSVTTSTDEGATWKRLPKLKRRVYCVYGDVDGTILIGTLDLIFPNTDTTKSYRIVGLLRYDPVTDSITPASAEKLPYNKGVDASFDRVRRYADGHLYAMRSLVKRSDIVRSEDNGKTWTSVSSTFLQGDSLTTYPYGEFFSDRDQQPVVVMADNQHRRLYKGKWEIIDDGFQIRGVAKEMVYRSYRGLPDGTWSYTYGEDQWMCVLDPSIDQIKPRMGQVFQPTDDVTLQWNAADGARYYTVEIEPGNRTYQTTSAAPLFTAPTLASGRYTWRTRAHLDVGTAPWTVPSVFSIAGSTTSVRADDPSPSDRMNASILTREVLQRRIQEMDVQPCFTDLSGRLIERWEDVPTPVLLIMVTGATQHLIIVQE